VCPPVAARRLAGADALRTVVSEGLERNDNSIKDHGDRMAADFFDSTYCERKQFWQRRRVARFFDLLFDLRIASRTRAVQQSAEQHPRREVLVATVAVPQRSADLRAVLAEFNRSRHRVSFCAAPMGDRGKFDNINVALHGYALDQMDWLVVTDDDVRLPPKFLDTFLFVAEAMHLKIAQPAHCCRSYATFTFGYRKWNSLGRATRYVESGPITAFHRDVFPYILPFPTLRWAWGTDIAWSVTAQRQGMAIGVVDCTPIEHLKPVAKNYPVASAIAEARSFLTNCGIAPVREEMFVDMRVLQKV
jgi:hypothetical protein